MPSSNEGFKAVALQSLLTRGRHGFFIWKGTGFGFTVLGVGSRQTRQSPTIELGGNLSGRCVVLSCGVGAQRLDWHLTRDV